MGRTRLSMKIMRFLQGAVLAAAIAGVFAMTTVAAYAQETDQATQGQGPVTAPAAPPAIPDYDQPQAPGDGYMWTPGYWAYGPGGYYWVDGAWVEPPYEGALWTPGYWGFGFGDYMWNPGYWGLGIGYYGGINYGFGYFGTGFWGGYWRGGRFFYNGEYNHLGFHNGTVYNHRVAGFDGRPGGAGFARGTVAGLNRGATAENRGSGINGRSIPSRGVAITPRSTYNSGGARGYTGAPAARGYSGAPAARGYSGAPAARGYSGAPAARGYSGAPAARGYSGGSYGGGARSNSGGGARASGGGGRGGGGGGHR